MKKGWRESKWQRVARYKLENEMGGNRYWKEEGSRSCRMCGCRNETWKHV